MADEETRIREGIARHAKECEASPIFQGQTQEQREARIRQAVRDSERRGTRPPLPPE